MERFHSFKQLCRVTAYVIRAAKKFIDFLRPGGDNLKVDDLTIEEVQNAEHVWLQVAQENFCKEGKLQQLTTSLRLYKDEVSLLRSKTRICDNDQIEDRVKFPVLLPNNHHVTDIIIMDTHEEVLHSGVNSTLHRVRLNYWIWKGDKLSQK